MNRTSILERLAPHLPPGVTAEAHPATITLYIDGEPEITVTGSSYETAMIKAVRMLPVVNNPSTNPVFLDTSAPTCEPDGQADESTEGHPDLGFLDGARRVHYRKEVA